MTESNESYECILCYDTGNEISKLPCSHEICAKCYENWSSLSNECPFCKKNLQEPEVAKTELYIQLSDYLQKCTNAMKKLKKLQSRVDNDDRAETVARDLVILCNSAKDIGVISESTSNSLGVQPTQSAQSTHSMQDLFSFMLARFPMMTVETNSVTVDPEDMTNVIRSLFPSPLSNNSANSM